MASLLIYIPVPNSARLLGATLDTIVRQAPSVQGNPTESIR
jgi:hypothetical protein